MGTRYNALCLDGANGGRAYSPDHPDFRDRNVDVRLVCSAPSWASLGSQDRDLIGRWSGESSFIGGSFGATSQVFFTASGDGSSNIRIQSVVNPEPIDANDEEPVALRFVLASGAPHSMFIYSKDVESGSDLATCEDDTGWEELAQMTNNIGDFFAWPGNQPYRIGDCNSQSLPWIGKAYALVDKVNGVTVANPDFTAQEVGTTEFVDGAGKLWVLQGSAEICREGPTPRGGFLRQRQRASEQDALRASYRNRIQ